MVSFIYESKDPPSHHDDESIYSIQRLYIDSLFPLVFYFLQEFFLTFKNIIAHGAVTIKISV